MHNIKFHQLFVQFKTLSRMWVNNNNINNNNNVNNSHKKFSHLSGYADHHSFKMPPSQY